MYNKKYRLVEIEELGRPNYIYLEMKGCVCYLAYFNPGEQGWYLYEKKDECNCWHHRVHTSIIKEVEYLDDTVVVTTQNTKLTFEVISE